MTVDPHFPGPADDATRAERLASQYDRIFALMSDGDWRTLAEISDATGDPPASVSAQLRHARKPRFGSHRVEREHMGAGLYRYRLTVNDAPPVLKAIPSKRQRIATMRLSRCFRGGDANERPGWWIGFQFDPGSIELLKMRVPYQDRVWDKDARLWWVAEAHAAVLREIFVNFATFEFQPRML